MWKMHHRVLRLYRCWHLLNLHFPSIHLGSININLCLCSELLFNCYSWPIMCCYLPSIDISKLNHFLMLALRTRMRHVWYHRHLSNLYKSWFWDANLKMCLRLWKIHSIPDYTTEHFTNNFLCICVSKQLFPKSNHDDLCPMLAT